MQLFFRRSAEFLSAAFVLFVAALTIAVATGCSDPELSQSAGSQLRRGLMGEPESLDPQMMTSTQAGDVLRDLGEGLLGYSPNGKIIGGAAESWVVSNEGKTYTFSLRDDLKWSNGDSLDADDFVFAFRRLFDPSIAAPYAASLNMITNSDAVLRGEASPDSVGVSSIDENTLRIELSMPIPYFVELLTHPSTFPIHAASLAAHGEHAFRPSYSISNGAYRLKEWVLGASLTLEKNPWYWDRESTKFHEVNYVVVDELSDWNRYRAGELDITASVYSGSFDRIAATRPDELRTAPYLGVYFYGFNLRKPPLAGNANLRKALSMAVDRAALVSKVTGRGEAPAYSWVPPGMGDYVGPRLEYENYSDDKREQEAQRLFAQSGFGPDNPLKLELRYNTSDIQERIAVAIQSMWQRVLGIEVVLINEEFRVMLDNVVEGEVTQVFRLSWTGDFNDPYSFLQLLHSGHSSNFFGYQNEKVDSLLDSSLATTDKRERLQRLALAEEVILRDHPLMPLYFYVSKHLVSSRISGWKDNVLDFHYSKHLSPIEEE